MSRTQDLANELPLLGAEGQPIGDTARAILRLVLERPVRTPQPAKVDPKTCPNCDCPTDSVRSPYCGSDCRDIANFIRSFRSGLRQGMDTDRQLALGQVLWRILGGGLPFRNSLISEKDLARLYKKTEGKCEECGAPATTVDHRGSHCNRTSNLRPVCDGCAVTKPFGTESVLLRQEAQAILNEIASRITSEEPIRPCDDAESWDWRAYVTARKGLAE